MKTAWYWHKNRYEDQWKRIEDPDRNPHSYVHLIFDNGAQNIQWRKDNFFNKGCWEKWKSAYRKKKKKLDPGLSPCRCINSNWVKDFSIGPETLKLVQERAGNKLELIGTGNNFNRTQKDSETKRKD
jgi:hypothetical protein